MITNNLTLSVVAMDVLEDALVSYLAKMSLQTQNDPEPPYEEYGIASDLLVSIMVMKKALPKVTEIKL